MLNVLLDVNIIDGPVVWVLYAVAIALAVVLIVRRDAPASWPFIVVVALVLGFSLGFSTMLLLDLVDAFGIPLPFVSYLWVGVAFAGLGLCLISLVRARWRRVLVAILAAAVFVLVGAQGVNAQFGINRTLGLVLGIAIDDPVDIPTPTATAVPAPEQPLFTTFTPPADMPSTGQTGTVDIPNTASGFPARTAGLYLPPAALVENPPALPFVLLMMGQPGTPDPGPVAAVLDDLAARNKGLAPIVLVADQLGDPGNDTLCLDTPQFGNVETYLTQDAVTWAKQNLTIIDDPRYWTVAGYSNGGSCALYFAAKYPQLFGNVLDISGEEYGGMEHPDEVLQSLFGGDQAAYDAIKPANILAQGTYPAGGVAVFTVGSDDSNYVPGAQRNAQAARDAGFDVTYYEVPNGGHVTPALPDGLAEAFRVLYPHLGLAAS